LIIQPNGKIIVVGVTFLTSPDVDWAMIRYNSDGSLDSTFDTDGIVTTAIGNNHDVCYSINIQGDGKIVLGGDYYNPSNNFKEMAVVRYDNNTTDIGKNTTLANTIQLFPNPVSNQVRVTGTQKNGELIIYSMEGKELKRNKTNEQVTIVDISELPIGIYFLIVRKDISTAVLKMIKSEN
jgi:uncharacterized delta-60 repeat protein